ncbi:sp110 nuclear body protein isoform X2 [Meles meles]|uniref:sp110 nuclear body protein isoform X2 n=1 Tax=Meles meles TaxID=9662 RepID=UPI001E69ADE0|nr:sp110 nuclear body protein isoform X2 [Meles meles]
MLTMTRALEEALLQHFIYQKLETAYAIYKPFPFLEGFRDNSFITETMYRESLEACRNQVPVPRVAYNILTHLEKTFSLSVLETLFSRINLREYPNLTTILKGFRRVVIAYGGWNRAVLTLLEAPANPAEGCSLQMLLPLPPPQSHQPPSPSVTEPSSSAQHSAEIVGEPSSPSDPAVALPRATQEERIIPEDPQEMFGSPPNTVQVITDDSREPNDPRELQEASSIPPKKKGKKRKRCIWSTPKKRRQKKSLPKETSDDSPEMNEEKSLQEPPSTPSSTPHGKKTEKYNLPSSKRRQERKLPRTSPRPRIQEKLHAVDQATEGKDDSTRNSKIMTRAPKARTECVQTSGPKEKKRKKDVDSSSTRRCQKNIPPKEKPEDETVDFLSPELPVTCGEAKGILYKEKLKQVHLYLTGSSEKCIQNEEGVWFTPKEFEIQGKRANTKKWKETIYCRGKTLGELLKKGFLFCPPRSVKREIKSRHGGKLQLRCCRKRHREELSSQIWDSKTLASRQEGEHSKECEVCCRGGPLVCCDTCPRAFHEDCHIPSAEAERSPWTCTFCRMKESSGRQLCHRESEVLERQMQPEEQLKCEFLLLKAYCHPQSFFFAETPHNIRDYGEPFKEAMWLDLIKERLTENMYTVAWFVRDMRLIFSNHKTFYKASNFGQIGLDLEAEFEKNLKEVFISCKANENSFQTR